jgi:hypothetical protein
MLRKILRKLKRRRAKNQFFYWGKEAQINPKKEESDW